MNNPDLLQGLNPEQLSAVTHTTGPLMIIAGAGTGKTKVITHRIAWLILEQGVDASAILALTFTEKATKEMQERVDEMLPIGYVDMTIATFHSFCERLLREFGSHIGIPRSFSVIQEADLALLMRQEFDRFELKYYAQRGNRMHFVRELSGHFSKLKNSGLSEEQYFAFAESMSDSSEDEEIEKERVQELARAFRTYNQILAEKNVLDFDDLLLYANKLLQDRPQVRAELKKRFTHVLVDEFQDTNSLQYQLVRSILNHDQNITIVGDDDQSIYAFRGANIENILTFKDDFQDAKMVVLNKNYRSGQLILNCAYRAIQKNNPQRLEAKHAIDKQLQSQIEQIGEVESFWTQTIEEEVDAIIERIGTIRERGANWSDIAILLRSKGKASTILTAFDRLGIPYKYNAQDGLYLKAIVKDVLSWFFWLDRPYDDASAYRICNHRESGISHNVLATVMETAKRDNRSYLEVLRDTVEATSLLEQYDQLVEQAKTQPVSMLCMDIVKTTGIGGAINLLPEIEQEHEYAYLNRLFKRLQSFEQTTDDYSLHHFLIQYEHERASGNTGALQEESDQEEDAVAVMTIHASKGLEFPYVFVPHVIQNTFPSTNMPDSVPLPEGIAGSKRTKEEHTAEERRLFYVACTRAKQYLCLSYSVYTGGKRANKPSIFFQDAEIDIEHATMTIPVTRTEQRDTTNIAETALNTSVGSDFSFTQLAAYTRCPMQYKFAHILGAPTGAKFAKSFGTSIHNTLEDLTSTYLQENRILTSDELTEAYKQNWVAKWFPSPKIRDEYFERGLQGVLHQREQWLIKPPKILAREAPFNVLVSGVKFKGRIDRIDEIDHGIEIIDYKTGKAKKHLDFDDKRQLLLYALAVDQCFAFEKPVVQLTLMYPLDKTSISFVPTDKDLEKLQSQIKETVALINHGKFPPNPGDNCQTCDFNSFCEYSSV